MTEVVKVTAERTSSGVGPYEGIAAKCPRCGWVNRLAFSGGLTGAPRRVSGCAHLLKRTQGSHGQNILEFRGAGV